MKPCPEFRESITLLAARSLEPAERQRVEGHLASCQDCGDYFERQQGACNDLERLSQALPTPELSGAFHRRLVERVRADAATSASASSASAPSLFLRLRELFSLPRLGYALAIAVVFIGALLWMERGSIRLDPRTGRDITPIVSVPADSPPAPTLMALSRALHESEQALDSLLARQEQLLAASDPPSTAGSLPNGVW